MGLEWEAKVMWRTRTWKWELKRKARVDELSIRRLTSLRMLRELMWRGRQWFTSSWTRGVEQDCQLTSRMKGIGWLRVMARAWRELGFWEKKRKNSLAVSMSYMCLILSSYVLSYVLCPGGRFCGAGKEPNHDLKAVGWDRARNKCHFQKRNWK